MKYFLGRVSSKEQNLARQLKVAREKFDIPDENVYCDKITGSSFDRPQYNALKAIVREGDEVIVKEFDRFGRNKDEMKRELEWFKQKGVIVRILDIPTTLIDFKDQTWVLEMVNNILIEVLGAVAEQERKKTKQRQAEGIAAAKSRGVQFGRKPKEKPPEYPTVLEAWRRKELSARAAAARLGITHKTFQKWAEQDTLR